MSTISLFRRGLAAALLMLLGYLGLVAPAQANVVTVNGITVEINLPQAQRGVPYSFQITPTGGTGTYSFQILSGAFPIGINMDSSGLITGVNCQTNNGTFPIDIAITSGTTTANFSGNKSFSFNMTAGPGNACAVTIGVGTVPPTGIVGTAYSGTVTASNGTSPYTFSIAAGSLPPGLSIDPTTGAITGVPTTTGVYTFTIKATDSASPTPNTGYNTATITVTAGAAISISPATLPNGTFGTAYSTSVVAAGGTAPYTYSVSAGALPDGLSLNASTGAITGTPSKVGSFSFTVTATDGTLTATKSYTVGIAGVTLSLAPATLSNGMVGAAYSQTVTASGGSGTGYQYTVSSGSLPNGLALNGSSGAITGNPSAAGTFTFSITATDDAGNVGTVEYSVTIVTALAIGPASLPNAVAGTPYSQALSITGGAGGATCEVTAGSLPAGLTLNKATCTIEGTPATAGSYSFTVTATDSAGNTVSRNYTLVVVATIAIAPASLPNGTYGTQYSQTVTATGGAGSGYSYSVSAGALPDGLTLNTSTGVISGTPSKVGSYSFTIAATDGTLSASQAYTVVISAVALTIGPDALPKGSTNVNYSQALTITGGSGTYTCEVTAGTIPPGLTLDKTTCTISGKPTTAGSYSFTVTATDSAGNSSSKEYTLVIDAVVITIGPAQLEDGEVSTDYTQTLVVTGGKAPYVYSVSTGALPDGLTLNPSTGAITGVPTKSGRFTFTVRVVDANGNAGTRNYVVDVVVRPDPSKDPEVIGKIDSQFESARRFGEGQTNNLMGHLMGAHGAFQCGFHSDVQLNGGMATQERNRLDGSDMTSNSVTLNKEGRACDEDLPQLGYWLTGSFERVDGDTENFTSDGLTAGVDVKVTQQLLLGAAVGYGWDNSKVGDNGTTNDSEATSLMAYASYNPTGRIYVDALLGYGSIGMDGKRYVSPDDSFVNDSRDGSLLFGSLGVTMEHRATEALFLAGYLRYDFIAADLDGYAERGDTVYALTYDSSSQTTGSTVLGGRLAYDMPQPWGRVTPMVRTEWRHRFVGSYDQTMWYSDTPGTTYTLNRASTDQDVVSVSAGFETHADDLTFGFEFGTSSLGQESFEGPSVRATISYGF